MCEYIRFVAAVCTSPAVWCVRVRVRFFSYSFYLNSFYSVYQKADMQKIHTHPDGFSQHSFHSRSTLSGMRPSRSCDFIPFHSHPFLNHAVRMPLSQTLMFTFFSSFATSAVALALDPFATAYRTFQISIQLRLRHRTD